MHQRKAQPIRLITGVDDVAGRLAAVQSTIHTEYCKQHNNPWIVAYSGGKDSSLLLHLVLEAVLATPAAERKRKIYVIANDTLVESPLVVKHMRDSMAVIKKAAQRFGLSVETKITTPFVDQTFWVNVIGKGYIPPTRDFRWCTDRMKIKPTNELLKKIVGMHKRAVLLIGTRKSESTNRRRTMQKHGVKATTMNKHSAIAGCRVFAPLADLVDNDVWTILMQRKPPWGGTHRKLITLYRNAGGGECPLVLTKDDAPSCGTTSPRFGCWTCTVIDKDKSMRGLISAGHAEQDKLEALADFREWLKSLRDEDGNRMDVRRNGNIEFRADNSRVLGPFKLAVREKILAKLLALQEEINETLISDAEKDSINDIIVHKR